MTATTPVSGSAHHIRCPGVVNYASDTAWHGLEGTTQVMQR
jgi:hypothetical protein